MKKVVQCVYTQMQEDTYMFTYSKDVVRQDELTQALEALSSNKAYSFFTDIEDLAVGELVLVETSGRSNRFGLGICQVCRVEGISKPGRDKAENWIIQRIDLTGHVKRMQKAAKVQELKNALHDAKEQAEEYLLYKALAKENPAIAALIKELHEIAPEEMPSLPEGLEQSPCQPKQLRDDEVGDDDLPF
jgi:hypothetical protein